MITRSLFCLTFLLCSPLLWATNVKDFGAKGDGVTDDTEAILHAVASVKDGSLTFPAGRYRITRPIFVDLSASGPLEISGSGGSSITIEAAGPAFWLKGSHKGSALPATVTDRTWQKERMATVKNIEILGNHPEADGIWLEQLMQPTLHGCLIRKVRHGIRLFNRNRNVLIEGNHIYDCTGAGIYLDEVNLHQIIVSHSHISYCQEAGIKVRSGEIRNFQITGNDIEYNFSPDNSRAADICIDLTKGGSVREGTITSNTIQALKSNEGANIRFSGDPSQPHKLGLWSITGNHISNQQTGILLENTRGISITGNTFVRCYTRHLDVRNSSQITFSGNVIDHNIDYFPAEVLAEGGISIRESKGILITDNVVETPNAVKAAIEINNSQHVSVRGNHLPSVAHTGIELTDSQETVITGNTLIPVKEKLVAIRLHGDCTGSEITGNRFRNMTIVKEGKSINIKGTR